MAREALEQLRHPGDLDADLTAAAVAAPLSRLEQQDMEAHVVLFELREDRA